MPFRGRFRFILWERRRGDKASRLAPLLLMVLSDALILESA